MYTPPAFVVDDTSEIHAMMRACRIANFITATAQGPLATPLPMLLDAEEGEMVPTWNYTAVQAKGPVEFFDDPARLLDVVKRLTDLHEAAAAKPWAVSDAPAAYITAQLRGIVGIRMSITHLTGKRKLSQNRPEPDRMGVRNGLSESHRDFDRVIADMIPVPSSSS